MSQTYGPQHKIENRLIKAKQLKKFDIYTPDPNGVGEFYVNETPRINDRGNVIVRTEGMYGELFYTFKPDQMVMLKQRVKS
jgi:hypothetical protein